MTDREPDRQLDFLLNANRLKTTPRTGWAQRGVPSPESVADHSHGVALTALLLADLVDEDMDREKVLSLAVLHDLAESVTGDLSLGVSRLLPAGAKNTAERGALEELLSGLSCADRWTDLWTEFEEQASPEARLVRDADRLDLLNQTLVYERTTGNRQLGEFWEFAPVESFTYPASQELVRRLQARRRET
ncbi:MAG: HD family hydrolase [bacterium]